MPWSWVVLAQAYEVPGAPDIAEDAAYSMIVALLALFIGLVGIHSAYPVLLLFAFVLACLALMSVTVHFLTNILARIPSISTMGWVDWGLSASAFFGSAIDLGLNWGRVQAAL